MSNSGKIWDVREAYKKERGNQWSRGQTALFGGGTNPVVNTIDTVNISVTGNATDFGDLSEAKLGAGGVGNSTRACFMAGYHGTGSPHMTSRIDYNQFSSAGNSADFGDVSVQRYVGAAAGNEIRGIMGGGYASPNFQNVMDFITFASLGNATDFGNLTSSRSDTAALSSPTRTVFAGGSPGVSNVMDFVTTSTTGNATDFGDLTAAIKTGAGSGSNTIGLFAGGGTGSYPADNPTTTVNRITTATTGNASDYGDLTVARVGLGGGSNNTRSVFASGSTDASQDSRNTSNVIDYIEIASSGNATDFGDLTVARRGIAPASNGNGGLVSGESQRLSVTYMPGSGRAFFGGGNAPGEVDTIQFVTIPTKGNAVDFGNLTRSDRLAGACSSLTRAIFLGGLDPKIDTIDYVEMQSQGNAADFGNLTNGVGFTTGCSSTTRGIRLGGLTPTLVNTIDYITMATVSNATDFGDLLATTSGAAGSGSSTRGLAAGGITPDASNVIQYITIASTGNATDFGDLTENKNNAAGLSSATRSVNGGGGTSNVMDYVTIASTGNATDFGDLTTGRGRLGASSNSTTGIFAGGETPSNSNVIDFITITTTGNAADYGDLIAANAGPSSGQASDSHGGLQA